MILYEIIMSLHAKNQSFVTCYITKMPKLIYRHEFSFVLKLQSNEIHNCIICICRCNVFVVSEGP